MRTVSSKVVIVILIIIIVALVSILVLRQVSPGASITGQISSTTATTASSSQPLHVKVTVAEPTQGQTVPNIFQVSGSAPGNWYFEASFPLQVRDGEGAVIGRAIGSAQGDWMTESLVPFTANVVVDSTYHGPATLVLMRDNPSGLPENDDAFEVPIVVQ